MAKDGEITYLQKIGESGRIHSLNKPFSDNKCGRYLVDIGLIMSLIPDPPARLLDLGCGAGWTSAFFSLRGYDVTSQDIASDMICLAQKNAQRFATNQTQFIVADYESMDFENEFDVAVFYDSLHHAVDEEAALLSCFKSLKYGGICVTAEPGALHARSKDSVHATKHYNVTEKNMPPKKIIQTAKRVGFSSSKVYLRYRGPSELLHQLTSRGLVQLARNFLKVLPLAGMLTNNIVVLRK